jgi:hypothetical protein
MHARRSFVAVVVLCSLLTPVCLLAQAAPSEGPREPAKTLAEVTISPSRVDWLPLMDYERLVLTVAGPQELYIRQEFEAGQPPALGLFDSRGNPLPEGNYSYELWITPRKKAGTGLPLRHSGYLAVSGGSFVTMDSPEATAAVPRSPVKQITAEQIISEGVCIGDLCTTGDEGAPLRLKDDLAQLILDGDNPNILFKDDTPGGFSADHSFYLAANQLFNSAEFFTLGDAETNNKIITVEGDAPDASLYVRSNGNVGLGTSTPAGPLHIYGSATDDAWIGLGPSPAFGSGPAMNIGYGGLSFGRGAGFLNVRPDASATAPNPSLRFLTANSERMIITNTGSVGIGTSSPGVPLHVSRSTGATLEGIRLTNDNEARITIENTTQSTKYIMAVNNTNPALFFISRDGGGGTIIEVNKRLDAGGVPSLNVNGSVAATNVIFSSSRDLKKDFRELDPQTLLAQVARLPISEWSFKDGPEQVRHIGPMAEDFHAAFGLSQNQDTISVTDTTGVALAAIQALLQRVEDLEMRNADLTERLLALESPRLENPNQP